MEKTDTIEAGSDISRILGKTILSFVIFVLIFELILFPIPVLAEQYNINMMNNAIKAEKAGIDKMAESIVQGINYSSFPKTESLETGWSSYFTITAYNSEVGQCDATPCITANGFNVCEHGVEDTIATNYLKFGTRVKIPELFGDRVFVVRDRMNPRYDKRIDIWMLDKTEARQLGLKYAKVEVLE